MKYNEANGACKPDLNGHLAIVKDFDLNNFLIGLAEARSWAGARMTSPGIWEWTDGTPWQFSDFVDGEPNNNDQCLTVRKESDSGWADYACNYDMPRLCQVGNTSPSPTSGTIESINFPNDYPNNRHHTFKLIAPEGKVIHLVWIEYEIEQGIGGSRGSSCYDWVKVTDKDGSLLMDKVCQIGLPDPPELTSNFNEINIEFKSDSNTNKKGYKAEWSSVDPAGRKKRNATYTSGKIDAQRNGQSFTFEKTPSGRRGSAGVSLNRERRQTVNLVTTRELECADWHSGTGGYWKYDKKIPYACYSKG